VDSVAEDEKEGRAQAVKDGWQVGTLKAEIRESLTAVDAKMAAKNIERTAMKSLILVIVWRSVSFEVCSLIRDVKFSNLP
jgi:hypothetical protein